MGQLRGSSKLRCDPKSHDVLEACSALTECAAQIESEPCKGGLGRAAVSLLKQIEVHCRESIDFLLQGLGNAAEGADAQFDRVWTLHVMARRSEGMKQCILEPGGSNLVLAAMAAHPLHAGLMMEGSWLLYDLQSLAGLEAMLQHQCPAVQAAAAWVIYDLAGKKDRVHLEQDGPNAEAAASGLIALLLGVLKRSSTTSAEALWGACSALSRLVYLQPTYGRLFVNHGGGEAVISACRASHEALQNGSQDAKSSGELLGSAAKLLATIADGNDQAAQQLRQLGALEALVGNYTSLPPAAAEEVIWALGQLNGAPAVIEAIQRISSSPSSIHGLGVLAELLWQPGEDAATVHFQVASSVLSIAQNCETMGAPSADLALAMKSLGGVLHSLTPHIKPGEWPVADNGMALLVKAVGQDRAVAQEAAECIGKIAAISPAWRRPLETTLGILSQRVRSPLLPGDRGRLKKYLFWAMAAIAGLPAIVHEMRAQLQVATVQDAAICAIIDIFDDNLDCEYCLRSTHEDNRHGAGGTVLEAMKTVVEAMRKHRRALPVQYRGSQALGILYGILPEGSEVPSEVMEVVLAAWWRNPVHVRVGAGVCSAFRAFLPPARCGGTERMANVLTMMRAQDIGSSLKQALESFPESYTPKNLEGEEIHELLEDSAYILGVLEGPVVVLEVLGKSTFPAVQSCGLKALCELCRAFPELFPAATATNVVNASATLVRASQGVDVHRHAELLLGLLRGLGQVQ